MKLIDKLTEDILQDKYFCNLFNKSLQITAEHIFKKQTRLILTNKELKDLLRFADILSNSTNSISEIKHTKLYQPLITITKIMRSIEQFQKQSLVN